MSDYTIAVTERVFNRMQELRRVEWTRGEPSQYVDHSNHPDITITRPRSTGPNAHWHSHLEISGPIDLAVEHAKHEIAESYFRTTPCYEHMAYRYKGCEHTYDGEHVTIMLVKSNYAGD
jgi:hypothetical protein